MKVQALLHQQVHFERVEVEMQRADCAAHLECRRILLASCAEEVQAHERSAEAPGGFREGIWHEDQQVVG